MLTIREAQIETLAAMMRDAFMQRLIQHADKHFGLVTKPLGEEKTRQTVEDAWKLANKHRFVTEYGVCQMMNLMFAFGETFDQSKWAAPILAQENTPSESSRANRLSAAANKALEKGNVK